MQTKDQQIEALLKQNQQLIDQLKQQQSTTSVKYTHQPRQESSFFDNIVTGLGIGAGFSVADNIVDSFFD